MKSKPYIGVTGVASKEEVGTVCKMFSKAGFSMGTKHVPMLGFLVSYETLNGENATGTKYPPVASLPELLREASPSVFTTIHYRSRQPDTLSDQVGKLFDGIYEDGLCRAIQFNIVWPDLKEIGKIKKRFPDMQIILQASDKAMAGKSPREVAEAIVGYGDLLDYCLIDPSGGRGIEFDLEKSLAIYLELRRAIPDLTIGFAGGFTGESVATRLGIIAERVGDNFCIDAEGGLRDKNSLSVDKVEAYLEGASEFFRKQT